MFTNDKSALLQSLLFPVLIIIWGIARTVTDFLYAGGISAFTRLDALWRYVCFGAIICSVIAIIITLCGKVDTSRYFLNLSMHIFPKDAIHIDWLIKMESQALYF